MQLCDISICGKVRLTQPLLPPCYTCDTFLSEGSIPDTFCLFPVQKDHPLLLGSHTQGASILMDTGFDQPCFCQGFQQTSVGAEKALMPAVPDLQQAAVHNSVSRCINWFHTRTSFLKYEAQLYRTSAHLRFYFLYMGID